MTSALLLNMAVMMLGLTSSSGLAAFVMAHNAKQDCRLDEGTSKSDPKNAAPCRFLRSSFDSQLTEQFRTTQETTQCDT
jgi:hypothetical protein